MITDVPAGSYEIIISGTNRGSHKSLSYDDYAVTVNDDKIYLEGGNDHTTALAVREFRKLIEGKNHAITDKDSMTGDYATGISQYDHNTTYRLTWADEFDGTQIDSAKWNVLDEDAERVEGYNNKTSYRSDDPDVTYVKDGLLYISAKQTDDAYYGGKLMSNDKMTFRHGYAEIKAVIPDGKGFWTSFWMVGTGVAGNSPIYNTELNIFECGGDASCFAPNLHRWPKIESPEYPKTSLDEQFLQMKKRFAPVGKTFNDDFHTYGLEWDENTMKFTCDGEVYFKYHNTGSIADNACFTNQVYFIVSMAVGFLNNNVAAPDSTNDWENKNKLIVDYVHLYQLADQVLTISTQ